MAAQGIMEPPAEPGLFGNMQNLYLSLKPAYCTVAQARLRALYPAPALLSHLIRMSNGLRLRKRLRWPRHSKIVPE